MEVRYEKRCYNENTYNNRIYINVIVFVVENRLVISTNNNPNGSMYYFKFLFEG